MTNVIRFPTAIERETRRLDAAFGAHDVEAIMRIALASSDPDVRHRAAVWLLEVLNVQVVA